MVRNGRSEQLLICLLLFALLSYASYVYGAESPTGSPDEARAVMERISSQLNGINDMTCKMNIRLSSLGICLPFNARAYFKKPRKFRIKFEGFPSFLERARSSFAKVVPYALNADEYDASLLDDAKVGDRLCYSLLLVPRAEDRLKRSVFLVDKQEYVIYGGSLEYRDGSRVTSRIRYKAVNGYSLPVEQIILFELTDFSARADVSINNYKINEGVEDEVFDTGK